MYSIKVIRVYRLLPLVFAFLFLSPGVEAQTPKPVKWAYTVKQVSSTKAELIFTANIDKGFHVYSQHINPDVGPIPTAFIFNPDKNYTLSGNVTEGKSTEIYDPNFEAKLRYFSDEAVFTQKIKINNNIPFSLTGTVTFMVCDDRRCFPPEDLEFSFSVNGSGKEDVKKTGTPSESVK